MRMWRWAMIVVVAMLAVGQAGWGASARGGVALSPKDLQDLGGQLGSADFGQRQAGQKILDGLTSADLEGLRALARDETDPEVKARLDSRIKALAGYELAHPRGLSLHVKNTTLQTVATELQRQVGPKLTISASGEPLAGYTLDGDDIPFWKVISELNRQSPVYTRVGPDLVELSSFPLSPPQARPPQYFVVDTFRITFEFRDNALVGPQHYIRFICTADPRVGIMQYSLQPHITKITDDKGVSLLGSIQGDTGALSGFNEPGSTFIMSSRFDRSVDVKTIKSLKDFEATVEMALLEKQTVHTVDLTKPLAPVKTSQGEFTVTRNGAAITVLFILPAPGTASAVRDAAQSAALAAGRFPPGFFNIIPVRVYDKDHKLIVEGSSGLIGGKLTALRGSTGVGVGRRAGEPPAPLNLSVPAGAIPATLEIAVAESFQPYTLPIELHDIPVVPIVTPFTGGGRP
jgi:hypothetical protein